MSAGFRELADAAWQATKEGRELEARLLLAAAVTALAPEGVQPVVVGGTAVDFWAADTTGGSLEPSRLIRASQDVDIVVGGYQGEAKRLRRALHQSGEFTTNEAIGVDRSRTWYGKSRPFLVEIIDADLAGDPERVASIEIDGGRFSLWGPEDTAWQYAENAVSMRDRHDWTRARVIAAAQDLDWDYLEMRAQDDGAVFIAAALRDGVSYEELLARAWS